MLRSLFLIPIFACIGCTPAEEPYCGEAFCLTEKPTKVSKSSTAEDFNLYRLEYGDKHILIYEGNSPDLIGLQSRGGLPSDSLPAGFIEGQFYEDAKSYQLALRTPYTDWPTYVLLQTAHDPADMDRFSSLLKGKLATAARPSGK